MPPPAWFFTCAILIAAISMLLPGAHALPAWLAWCGAAVVALGVLLNAAALRAFARRGTPVDPAIEPRALVQEGPYAFTRNPMYLAGIVILAGLVLLFGEPRGAVVLPLYVWLAARRFVPSDERRMAALFGGEWRAYTRRVRRWL